MTRKGENKTRAILVAILVAITLAFFAALALDEGASEVALVLAPS